jgi:hypothetical protein
MLKKIILLFFILFTAVFSTGVNSSAPAAAQECPEAAIEEILAYYKTENHAEDVQTLIDGYFSDTAGETAEWFIWALRQYEGSYSFSSYSAALLRFLNNNHITNASTREKYALALLASGSDHDYIAETAENAIGGMGIMSYLFGLHLINNGVTGKTRTAQSVIAAILASAHEDGGWSVRADPSLPSDVDVTAMALQALAPYKEEPEIAEAVEKALDYLSEKQTAEGDYAAFGGRNAESCAQVIIALCALGRDPLTDARFQKNGRTVLDGLRLYRLTDGTYSHFSGENYSLSATQQALTAYVALWRYRTGKTPFYLLDDYTFAPSGEQPEEIPPSSCGVFAAWKLWTAFGIAAGTVIAIVCLFLFKRGGPKESVACALLALACMAIVAAVDIQSKDTYYSKRNIYENPISVTVSIRCDALIGHNNPYIPSDGVILASSEIQIEEGGTVFDAVKEATRRHIIPMEYKGETSGATYISGLNYLYEFDYGDLSGWMYAVNGMTPGLGCAEYTLEEGDTVLWYYTLESGNDAAVYGVECEL